MKTFLTLWVVVQIFFYNPDGDFGHNEIIVPANLPVQYQAWVVFSEIFERGEFDFVPRDVRVIGVDFEPAHGILTLNLSHEVLNYGGTYFEERFTQKLIKNALNLPDVRYFTLLVEGELQEFPEGVKIYLAFFY